MDFAKTSDYFKILSNNFPEWPNNYINTGELQTQKISARLAARFIQTYSIVIHSILA